MRLFINWLFGGWMSLAVLFVALTVTACGSGEETDNAQVQADISPVIPKISGTVLAIRTDDNRPAKLGDTLVVLDDREFALRVQQADVAVQQAEANVVLARKTAQTARSGTGSAVDNAGAASAGIAQAQAGIQVAEVRALQARQNFERQARLLEQQSTPR
ncbi:MAG: biotin/lipoyl-binding protein, partial [Bacteroidetes bacterium]|nr:biotin/lipoyl-binding protein [Fibrella sp.]